MLKENTMSNWVFPVKRLVLSNNTSLWCKLPYHNHPKGCPNYGKKCSPGKISDVFDMEKPIFIIHSEFDLESHEKMMKERHPDWTRPQCRNVLYWQPKSRKQLKERVGLFLDAIDYHVEYCPELYGVNVFATCLLSGLKLEKTKDLKICRHVALVGQKKVNNVENSGGTTSCPR